MSKNKHEMADSVQTFFTTPFLVDLILSGAFGAGIWWKFYKFDLGERLTKAYDTTLKTFTPQVENASKNLDKAYKSGDVGGLIKAGFDWNVDFYKAGTVDFWGNFIKG